MSIGIGGAGSKLSSILDNGQSTIVDVSGVELERVPAGRRIRGVVHSSHGQLRGSRKDPRIGREAFQSIRNQLIELIQGNIVFSSTGGGTGNGICTELLEYLADLQDVPLIDKTTFVFVLPYPEKEASDFIENSIDFLRGPLSASIDTGNTGNIILVSNAHKFIQRIPEKAYNEMIIGSIDQFLKIPEKGEDLEQLDGNIDAEDFILYRSKPYINHFCQFHYDPEAPFSTQLEANYNPLLLKPGGAIEALFLLELPDSTLTSKFYGILDYFAEDNVLPTYAVLHNPNIEKPLISVSILYSRKPLELVESFNKISGRIKRTRIRKSVDQYVTLSKLDVDLTTEAQKVVEDSGNTGDDILNVLKRIGKL